VAGISLGILTAIRIAGPFAGLLVLLFYLLKTKNLRSTGSLMLYLFIAYLTTYIFWPALWREPIKHFVNTFHLMSQFPAHDVLYLGKIFSSQELPWHFFPRLIILQLTEPAMLLFVLGIISFSLVKKVRENFSTPEMIVIMVWFTVPLAGVVFLGLPSYGNFRHYLFSLPPIFFIGGVGLDWLLKLTRGQTLRIGIVVLLLIPGMISLVQLHPYEYIYYNSLAGGVKGAEGYYELDYWCTSYREAVEYVNQNAPSASRVVAWGPTATAQTFARGDLLIMTEAEVEETPDYALACDDALYDSDYYTTFGTLYEVKVMGATISRLKIALDNE
jgi:hypothetical protein